MHWAVLAASFDGFKYFVSSVALRYSGAITQPLLKGHQRRRRLPRAGCFLCGPVVQYIQFIKVFKRQYNNAQEIMSNIGNSRFTHSWSLAARRSALISYPRHSDLRRVCACASACRCINWVWQGMAAFKVTS